MEIKNVTEANLDDLIKKIKKDGINEANKKAEEIVKEAESKAANILEDAQKEARRILDESEKEIIKKEEVSKKAIEQAVRDSIISIRNYIVDLFDELIKEDSIKVLSGKTLESVLIKAIDAFCRNDNPEIEVFLSESDRDELLDYFLQRFRNKIKCGIELKVHPKIESGFRIGKKGDHIYYDFTDEGIAYFIAEYLNPRFYSLIDSVKKDRRRG